MQQPEPLTQREIEQLAWQDHSALEIALQRGKVRRVERFRVGLP